MIQSRRSFLGAGATLLAFGGLRRICADPLAGERVDAGYGPLLNDPNLVLELPRGFRYQVLSRSGEPMRSDGIRRPGQPDGMGCFRRRDGRVTLVINHEMNQCDFDPQKVAFPFGPGGREWPVELDPALAWARNEDGPQPGGTSTLIWNSQTGEVEAEFLSLTGTDRNCAGGVMPWGSWISCEEPFPEPGPDDNGAHGWCFEVPADAPGLVRPEPIRSLGRFRHEAVAIDPRSGVIYLTEDAAPGLFYRWVPDEYTPGERPDFGCGSLQALVLEGIGDEPSRDTRNRVGRDDEGRPAQPRLEVGTPQRAGWLRLEDDIEARERRLRERGVEGGAARFSRGEGIEFDPATGALFFACTDGGPDSTGQIFRYTPAAQIEQGGELELFIESGERDLLRNADNLCVAPWGDLIVCEDHGLGAHLVGVTPEGQLYHLARDPRPGDELAGVCFDEPSGTLFVNQQGAGRTLAIQGPWEQRSGL